MKICVSFESRVRPDSTGVYFLNAFRSLGHSVTHVLPQNIGTVNPGDFDFYVKCDDGIYSPWPEKLSPAHYIVIDTHIETDWRLKIEQEGKFSSVSCTHRQGLKLPWQNKNVFWLPVACDPDVHYAGKQEKKYDGCFIGNFHSQFAGKRIDLLDSFFKQTPVIFHGTRMFKEMAEKYAQSKLVFNCALNGDANMRFFEALCSGSCLVTDRLADIDALGFIDKQHYLGYTTKEELEELVPIYLREHSLREGIASAGRQAVLKGHTYKDRASRILEEALKTCLR